MTRSLNAWLATALLALFLGMVNYVAARHYARGDWTKARVYSISDKTEKVLRALDQDVAVTVFLFRSMRDAEAGELRADVEELLARFRRCSQRLKVEMVDPDRDPKRTELLAKQYEIKQDDLALGGVVVFASGKKHKYVTRDDIAEYQFGGQAGEERKMTAFKGEGAFLGALEFVTQKGQAELCFTSGHGEARLDSFEDVGLSALDEELKRDGYKTRQLDDHALEKAAPTGCAALVVAAPQRAFGQGEVDALDAHLRAGGRVLLLLGPVIDSNLRFLDTGVEDLAERWGIHVGSNVVVDDAAVPGRYRYLSWVTAEGWGAGPIGDAMKGKVVIFTLPREVHAKGADNVEARSIVRSSDKGWGETSLAFLRGDAELRFDAATDVKGPVDVAAHTERKDSGARMVVIGSADLVTNAQLRGGIRDYSRDFVLASLAWLLKQEAKVAVGPKQPENFRLALSEDQLWTLFLAAFVALPLLALGGGAAVWWRRRQ